MPRGKSNTPEMIHFNTHDGLLKAAEKLAGAETMELRGFAELLQTLAKIPGGRAKVEFIFPIVGKTTTK